VTKDRPKWGVIPPPLMKGGVLTSRPLTCYNRIRA